MEKEQDVNTRVFLELLKAGLWEKNVELGEYGSTDFTEIKRLAEVQSVVGLVTAGLEHVSDAAVPKEDVLTFVGSTLQQEQQNLSMNSFIEKLMKRLKAEGVYCLLVKGQGIAQCYERPLWRACGDVDLFLDSENYHKAKDVLSPIAQSVEEEVEASLHLPMIISGWEVELHGTLRPDLGAHINGMVDLVQKDTFENKRVRVWKNGETEVLLPAPDNDAVFVFTHILQHFYRGGIGLRQVCDWCRLLWTYRTELDPRQLESRIHEMGIMAEWKAFAALAVNTLGMPEDAMPLYESGSKWEKKADRVLSIILETGNFGHNKDISYYDKHSRLAAKVISVWKHTEDSFKVFLLFPKHAIISWWRMIVWGFKRAAIGK